MTDTFEVPVTYEEAIAMSRNENKAIIRRLAEAVNTGNLDAIDDIMAPGYVRRDTSALLKDVDRAKYIIATEGTLAQARRDLRLFLSIP